MKISWLSKKSMLWKILRQPVKCSCSTQWGEIPHITEGLRFALRLAESPWNFFSRRNSVFWDQIKGTPKRTQKWTRFNFHYFEYPIINFIIPLDTMRNYEPSLRKIGHQPRIFQIHSEDIKIILFWIPTKSIVLRYISTNTWQIETNQRLPRVRTMQFTYV